jgi:glycosyltransferase involved in cell wall biosynthesis
MPKISVIMPVYNCEQFVHESIASILNQTFSDFEFIIIDDGSKDQTLQIIKQFNDNRIILIENVNNLGIVECLNYGISISECELIARMDGDDIAHPNRFELQYDLFQNYSDLILCGSCIAVINEEERIDFPLLHDEIKVELLNSCCIAHPTVMFKKHFKNGEIISYNKNFDACEDYELWSRLIQEGRFMNHSKSLLQYRKHSNQISFKKHLNQKNNSLLVKIKLFQLLTTKEISEKFFSINEILKKKDVGAELDYLNWIFKQIQFLNTENKKLQIFDTLLFSVFLDNHLKKVIKAIFISSSVFNYKKKYYLVDYNKKHPMIFSRIDYFKSLLKCVLCYNKKSTLSIDF